MRSVHLALALFGWAMLMGWSSATWLPETTVTNPLISFLPLPGSLTTAVGEHHSGSGNCVLCHGADPVAMLDANGHNVSVVTDWESTMMANSAKDPMWRAKMAHEALVNPDHADEIQDVCTGCHAPAGHHEAHFAGDDLYTLADLVGDSLGLDGISCTACHTINDDSLRWRFNGDLPTNEDGIIWGPFTPQTTMPMQMHVDYTPTQGSHFLTSDVCAPCHSLYTHTFDLEGEPTGGVFFEQSTYLEWLNSSYAVNDVTCQACHMPLLTEGVVLSDRPPWLQPNRLGRHTLVGGNVLMLRLLRNNINSLGLTATSAQFDSTLSRTEALLQNHTAELSLDWDEDDPAADLVFNVEVSNLAGHKFPSGYPSRVAFLEFTVIDTAGNQLFRSGGWSPEEGIWGRNSSGDATPFEPHWQEISEPDQVQVYEMVFADVDNQPSTVLARADHLLKDNRLPPLGFSTQHMSYDTAAYGPAAALDEDFNHDLSGSEGSGTDRLSYLVSLNGYDGPWTAEIRLHYLSVPRAWLEEMFALAESSEDIALFQGMFDSTDQTPILVAYDMVSTDPAGIEESTTRGWRLSPNPSHGGTVRLIGGPIQAVNQASLWDASGRMVRALDRDELSAGIDLQGVPRGTFLVQLHVNGVRVTLRGVH